MLLLTLHKKGEKSDPENYKGISLIHPLGRLFCKTVTNKLKADPNTKRAVS